MNLFVFIADAWGPVGGGINSFNYDLVIACALAKKDDNTTHICCLVPDLTDREKQAMEENHVIPLTIPRHAFDSSDAHSWIFKAIQQQRELHHYYPDYCNTLYVGHDIYTGKLSRSLAEKYHGLNITFHHMDYKSYYLYKNPNPQDYRRKVHEQKEVLCSADLVCAVGPVLTQSAMDKTRGYDLQTIEVFPGLADFKAIKDIAHQFSPIVFGRVEKDNQRIKQITLAIDSFANAIKLDQHTPIIGDNPTLSVIGYDYKNKEESEREVFDLQEEASNIAGKLCNITPFTYTTDRESLGRVLSEASLAMMLSYHEGFGLVGYEAIAAGIPLILSTNTGLYKFLENEDLDHLVYPVDIKGAMTPKGYSPDDMQNVSSALREIRQKEHIYKEKALKLRRMLRERKDRYSWNAVANNFIQNVLKLLEPKLHHKETPFISMSALPEFRENRKASVFQAKAFGVSEGGHVFVVEGCDALQSLVYCLKDEHYSQYYLRVYPACYEKETFTVFIDRCREFLGTDKDYKNANFKYILGDRLENTILILNNFPKILDNEFNDLFALLDNQQHDFIIFVVIPNELPAIITPFRQSRFFKPHHMISSGTELLTELTDEQRLLVKILAFKERKEYDKSLVRSICKGINRHCNLRNYPAVFENIADMENDLVRLGFIEELAETSYQNTQQCLITAAKQDESMAYYALGIIQMGYFYAKRYQEERNRDPQLSWGYLSCQCFACAAALDNTLKEEIKAVYESILIAMRKKAMDTSDYDHYYNELQSYINEYIRPNNPWILYNLIHCESLCCPSKATLEKIIHVLDTEFTNSNANIYKAGALYIQFIRLYAELESELNMPGALIHLIDKMDTVPLEDQVGTVWAQCVSTLITLATDEKEYDIAEKYLRIFRQIKQTNSTYQKVIATAMETNFFIAQYLEGKHVDLTAILEKISNAYYTARDRLRDYRAQGWTVGLWGECQILLGEPSGNRHLYQAMEHRKRSGVKNKNYRNWLQRISSDSLDQQTRDFIYIELARIEA